MALVAKFSTTWAIRLSSAVTVTSSGKERAISRFFSFAAISSFSKTDWVRAVREKPSRASFTFPASSRDRSSSSSTMPSVRSASERMTSMYLVT